MYCDHVYKSQDVDSESKKSKFDEKIIIFLFNRLNTTKNRFY